MPTYDYKCSKCEHSFEKILKIADRDLPTKDVCPNCSAESSVEMCISASTLVSPFSVDGLKRPQSQFRERMKQIKSLSGKTANIKDY